MSVEDLFRGDSIFGTCRGAVVKAAFTLYRITFDPIPKCSFSLAFILCRYSVGVVQAQDLFLFPSRYKTVPDSRYKTVPDSRYKTVPDSRYKTVPDSRYKTVPDSRYKFVPDHFT